MARESKKVISKASREDAETAMATLASVYSQLKKLEAKIELEKQRIDEKYQQDVVRLQKLTDEPKEVLEVWAKSDCKNWEGKSFDLMSGTVGFRTGTPKVEKNKKFTWDAVTELLSKHFPALVRTKTEPNKEAIIAMRDTDQFEKLKDKCYVNVVQDETFFTIPKEEELAVA